MRIRASASLRLVALMCGVQFGVIARAQVDHSALHKAQFVTVDRDVHLEVLDWGGPQGQTLDIF